MRYRLRTLMIVLAVRQPVIAPDRVMAFCKEFLDGNSK
jgi:hypothetical protein